MAQTDEAFNHICSDLFMTDPKSAIALVITKYCLDRKDAVSVKEFTETYNEILPLANQITEDVKAKRTQEEKDAPTAIPLRDFDFNFCSRPTQS
jgi:hypothetical protein